MNFCTLGSQPYFKVTLMNVDNVKRLHPESRFFVGDIGLNPESVDLLKKRGCEIIEFPIKKDHPGGNTTQATEQVNDLYRFGAFTKALMLLFVLDRVDSVVFMDADAVLIRPFDAPMTKDATVTVRPENPHGRINSGVLWISNRELVYDWLQCALYRIITSREMTANQSGLIDAVDRYDVDEVPCSKYNYTTIKKGIPCDVRVVHLKSRQWKNHKIIKKVEDYINETLHTSGKKPL